MGFWHIATFEKKQKKKFINSTKALYGVKLATLAIAKVYADKTGKVLNVPVARGTFVPQALPVLFTICCLSADLLRFAIHQQ